MASLRALTALGAQGCAAEAAPADCESLQGSSVQQLQIELESGDVVVGEKLELCVKADNYDACETLEQIDKSNTYAVTYNDHLEHVVSVVVRVPAPEPSLASKVSDLVMEE